jgi:hypothetical protein
MKRSLIAFSLRLLILSLTSFNLLPHQPFELSEVRKIWDGAPHNAFTDLIHHQGEWICVFREGEGHVSADGKIRILVSRDVVEWESAALLASDEGDLRDPKITLTPEGELMLTGAMAQRESAPPRHVTLAWFSSDARNWTAPVQIGDENIWLWRIAWHEGKAYGIGYGTAEDRFARLYTSEDGKQFETRVPRLFEEGYPNETALLFQPDGSALCLLRRDGNPSSALLGAASPPFKNWTWRDLGARIGGPAMLRLPDGRLLAAVRLYQPVRTSLAIVDPVNSELREVLELPSGGDTSYAGMVIHEDKLWISYYSSHEGRSSIYLATVRLPE